MEATQAFTMEVVGFGFTGFSVKASPFSWLPVFALAVHLPDGCAPHGDEEVTSALNVIWTCC